MILAELPSWVDDFGKSILWIAGIITAFGIIFKAPWIKRPGQWVWRHLVSNPTSAWGKQLVGGVVESHLADSKQKMEAVYNFVDVSGANQNDIKAALQNLHECIDRRSAEQNERIEKLTQYTEEVLAEAIGAKERIRQLYKALDIPVYETDVNGHCTYVNPAYSKLSGLSVEDSLGEGWIEALHPEDRTRVFKMWESATDAHIDFNSVFRFRNTTTGDVVRVRASAKPLHDGVGNVAGWVGTFDLIETESTNLETQ